MTVLIADDSELIRSHLSNLIYSSKENIKLITSPDVATTIQKLQQNNINVLILDISFPDGSGFNVLEFLQSQEEKPFVMVLTNLINQSVRKKGLKLGADLFFDKTEEYERVVEEIIRLHNT